MAAGAARFTRTTILAAAAMFAAVAGPWPAADAARILAAETMRGKSHWQFMSGVLRALVDGGHAVTVFTPFPEGDRDNYTEVDTSGAFAGVRDADLGELKREWGDAAGNAVALMSLSRRQCDRLYGVGGGDGDDEMERTLRGGRGRFDLMIVEPLASECVSHGAARLRVPVVYVTPLATAAGVMERVYTGHFTSPAATSHSVAGYAVPGTFAQRAANAAQLARGAVARTLAERRSQRAQTGRPYDDDGPVAANALVFVNGHFASDAAGPVAANVVNVGGVHLRPPDADGLPQDILDFIEGSSNGVVYFTFGSTVKMASIPEHIIKAFIEALAQLPQRVLMKYEEEMDEKPKNVMTKKWLPQRDILLHPKVKLFISHGGISGLYEAVDAGVPVLGFPLFGDQHRNVDNLVNAGMAISVDLSSVSKDVFLKNLLEILNDKRYTKNAKTASEIFKDRPMTPAQLVIYWTEYVLRNEGAPHLKSHARDLTWYQYYLLDTILSVLIFISVVFFVTYKFLKSIYNHCFNYSRNSKSKSE